MKKYAALATAFCLALPAAAQAFVAENRLPVNEVGGGVFEVVSATGGSGSKAYWCAAADYARSQGAVANTRVYVVEGPGPSSSLPGRTAVRFTTDPQAAGVTPGTPELVLSVDVPGDNLAVASAQQYCYQALRRS